LRSRRALELLREAQALQPGEDDADLLRELEAAARAEPAGPPGSSTGR
jgi:hypothetical protein